MAQREAITVIVLTLSFHLLFVLDLPSYLINAQYSVSQVIVTNVSVGISLLLFPLFGFLADLYLTRYRIIQMSLLILTSMITLTLAISIVVVLSPDVWAVAGFGLATICIIASIGLFEANAIQFGTDQLLEAPSTQLSAFVHWYF